MRFLTYIFKWGRLGLTTLPTPATEWPHFITTNWPQVFPQKAHKCPGPWFNIKMPSYKYRKSHCGDKTVVRSSYLHNGIFYTGKTFLYWIAPQISKIIWPPTPHGEAICVKPRFWVSISLCCVHVSVMKFRWNANLCHIILIVFDAVRIVEPSPDEVEPSPDEI